MANPRIHWIDYTKAFSIIFVVFLHAGIPYPFRGIIRVFVILLFFFLSGMFSRTEKYPTFTTYFKNIGYKILIPYTIFNIITFLFWLLLGRHFGADENSSISPLKPFLGIFIGNALSLTHYVPLWFLTCLFVVQTLYYLIFNKIKNTRSEAYTIILLFLFAFVIYQLKIKNLPWGLDIAISMIIFFSIGAFTKDYLLNNNNNFLNKKIVLLIIGVFSAALVWIIYVINDEAKVYINELGNFLLFFVGAISGIIMMICFMKLITGYLKNLNFLLFVGQNTLIILALHLISGSFVKAIAYWVFDQPLSIFENPVVSILYAFTSILFLYPVILLINKYTPFILGKTHSVGAKNSK